MLLLVAEFKGDNNFEGTSTVSNYGTVSESDKWIYIYIYISFSVSISIIPGFTTFRKQEHDKRGIEESLHVQVRRPRLTACEVGVFSRKVSQLSKIHPSRSFGSHLSSSPMGVFLRDYVRTKHMTS